MVGLEIATTASLVPSRTQRVAAIAWEFYALFAAWLCTALFRTDGDTTLQPFVLYAAIGWNLCMLALHDQSIGHWARDLRVVRAADGGRPGWWRSIVLRRALPIGVATAGAVACSHLGWTELDVYSREGATTSVSAPGLVFAAVLLVDALPMLFGAERRCIHDYLAGTKVVRCASSLSLRTSRTPSSP